MYAMKDSIWKLEFVQNVFTHVLNVFHVLIVQYVQKDFNFKVVNVQQHVLKVITVIVVHVLNVI